MLSLKLRFDQNKEIFAALSLFSPKHFASILDSYKSSEELANSISAFCRNYNIDSVECARELFNFAATFKKLNRVIPEGEKEEDEINIGEDEEEGYDETDGERPVEEGEERDEKSSDSYHHALKVLANPTYPLLYKVYAIALAIPISSCTAERTFSFLKRVKSRLRSTMEQERLEALLIIAVEKRIVASLDKEDIIDTFGKSSVTLSKLLIK